MVKKGDKTGQIYLISAIVLGLLVIGVFTISNYSKKESDIKLLDLKEEIQIESSYVLDYGLYNELSDVSFYGLMLDFSKNYTDYRRKDEDLYFIFGDQNNMTVTGWQGSDKTISISSGSSSTITTEEGEFTGGINPGTDTLTLSIDDVQYDFDLSKGENFYFVLSKKINKGEYVIAG